MSFFTPFPALCRQACDVASAACLAMILCSQVVAAERAPAESAAAIYNEKCAYCHGEQGQGVPGIFDGALYGEQSVADLARFIDRTMPDDDPEACVDDEAQQVAAYIYDAFYSPAARIEHGLVAPPRIELLRLTAAQYQNTVADLIGYFTPAARRGRKRAADQASSEPGLRAEYFQSDGMNKADERRLDRVDRRIDFRFGEESPAENITADQFAIIWNGSIFAPDSGHYDFRVSTENGVRLYLNVDRRGRDGKLRDDSANVRQKALIDAWVSSGKKREESKRVYLLGGRRYPLRLEFFKYKEPTASIKLEWKTPHGVWSVIDGTYLSTERAPRTWVVDTPLPADDRSLGYERGSSISQQWHTATTRAAAETAEEVVDRLPLLSGIGEEQSDRQAQLGKFLARFGRVAFRRPLTAAEEDVFREKLFAGVPNADAAVRRAVILALSSPQFVYADLSPPDAPPSQHTIAARLALALWDSIPDKPLLEAADDGQLATGKQIERQARRMLDDPRARAKLRSFFHHWLEIDHRDLAKDSQMYPEFDDRAIADLRRSLEMFVDHVVWSESSDYRELLLADYLFVNDRLQLLYEDEFGQAEQVGDEGSNDGGEAERSASGREFVMVRCPPARRAGILTHPYLLSAFAYHDNTSPIHRGVFLTRNIVGRSLKPPPVAVAFEDSQFAPELTMREKVTELTREAACMSCHSVINPLGFALENFDAVGRWRTSEKDKPIDPRSSYQTSTGDTVEVASARDIARFAVSSAPAHRAFVTQMFHHLVQQDPYAYGPGVIRDLRKEFADDDFNVQNLLVRIATLAAAHDPTASTTSEPNP